MSFRYIMQFVNVVEFAINMDYRLHCIAALQISEESARKLLVVYKIRTQPFYSGGLQRVYTHHTD